MSISLHLRGSKLWWAFLALRSNLDLASDLQSHAAVVLFDEASAFPRLQAQRPVRTEYCFVLWDGYITDADLASLRTRLLAGNTLQLLCVGDPGRVQPGPFSVRSFFAAGPLQFHAPVPLDLRSRLQLALARLKALTMPLKNLRQQSSDWRAGIALLFGKKQLVFCGSHGLNPKVLYQLSERHNVDPSLLRDVEDDSQAAELPHELHEDLLRRNGLRLAELFREGKIEEIFFTSAVHLLFRDFVLRRVRAAGLPLYSNAYASGRNINVYTTPFYRQHAFLDFGSVVGDGNYPRRADLLYYRKQMVVFALQASSDGLWQAAADGRLPAFFDELWKEEFREVEKAATGA